MSHPAILAGFFGLGGTEVVVIGLIALLFFGSRLPQAAKGLGESIKEFKKGVREGNQSSDPEDDRPR